MSEHRDKTEYIMSALSQVGLAAEEAQAEALFSFCSLLTDWNERMNLTAITDFEDIVEKHFLDSLAPLWCGREGCSALCGAKRVLDVGSGAGFPGIPLAIFCPGTEIFLLDSLNKRSEFQRAVREALGIDNLRIVNARAEEAARDAEHREQYDVVLSRAVADLSVLAEYCLPFAQPGGILISYKGEDISEEIRRAGAGLQVLGGGDPRAVSYSLPNSGAGRTLLFIDKRSRTPDKYPRRAGIPAKRPLK